MTMRSLRGGVHAVAAGLLCIAVAFGAAPTASAEDAPVSWEFDALGLSAAHASTQGEGVTVAVLDSGINADHPALAGRVDMVGPDFYNSDGLQAGDAEYGIHGTAMVSDVLKVAPKARIIAARVTNDQQEEDGKLERTTDGVTPVAHGIDWAVENGADVISMSLGGGLFAEFDGTEVAAAARAVHKGVTLLAAAGNSGGSDEVNEGNFPAGYANVISVAATQPGGGRAEFSTVRTHNTIASPGVGIVSADKDGGYSPVDGTSPATALASGVTALMLAVNPDLTPAQTRAILMSTADHPAGGHDALVGAGQINAAEAVRAAGAPPEIDTSAKAYTGDLENFGEPTGTPRGVQAPMETSMFTAGIGAVGVGLLLVMVGALLIIRKPKASRNHGR
ncbi:S8 family serine peptidase [Nocardia cyriacigeorgica]|uniref:S8 family serine peptidase n=3 Tax=Nocardia cyriacigeorgica TaxID=135487 RepID=A0A6P1D557_9NOCA|nr:S8 family serine peptidase [Nocardia cyriacigeorgica]NEW51984.1 S8 family serine peptidase [Nocardia cyriacigeorgica]NEW55777.1 S8 family serine peptidase [Nocardia cyriacigeorgica]